jgi:hypothetical protein
MTTGNDPIVAPTRTSELAGAIALGAGSLFAVVLMANHPSVHGHDTASALHEIGRISHANAIVHGGMLVVLAATLLGFVTVAERLGWRLARVRAAFLVQVLGTLLLGGAALVNGFVAPAFAHEVEGAAETDLGGVRLVLEALFHGGTTLASVGVIALSIALVLWSMVFVARGGAARAIAAFGLLVGVVGSLGILGGHLRLDVHGMGLVVLAQALWNASVAVWLVRTRA